MDPPNWLTLVVYLGIIVLVVPGIVVIRHYRQQRRVDLKRPFGNDLRAIDSNERVRPVQDIITKEMIPRKGYMIEDDKTGQGVNTEK